VTNIDKGSRMVELIQVRMQGADGREPCQIRASEIEAPQLSSVRLLGLDELRVVTGGPVIQNQGQ
jgi:hypothetical protein